MLGVVLHFDRQTAYRALGSGNAPVFNDGVATHHLHALPELLVSDDLAIPQGGSVAADGGRHVDALALRMEVATAAKFMHDEHVAAPEQCAKLVR